MNISPDLPEKKQLRINEVAVYFGVDDSTIRRWIDHGKLEATKPTGTWFISREAIKTFLLLGMNR